MKTKSFPLLFLFLILTLSVLVSCSPNSVDTDDELYEINNIDKEDYEVPPNG